MRMESFELDLVKGIIERIAQEKINDKPFDLIRFHTVLKMIKDRCWAPSPLAWRPDFPGAPREAH